MSASSTSLTLEMLKRVFVATRDHHTIPCGSAEKPHAVHPKAIGWTVCANCMNPVEVRHTEGPAA